MTPELVRFEKEWDADKSALEVNKALYKLSDGINELTYATGTSASGLTPGAWTPYPAPDNGTVPISAVTTAPTKGPILYDKAQYRIMPGGMMEVRLDYLQSGPGTSGSGDYLFGLPNGYKINQNIITLDMSGGLAKWWGVTLGTYSSYAADGAAIAYQTIGVVSTYPGYNNYVALKFDMEPGSNGSANAAIAFVSSSHQSLNTTNRTGYSAIFSFPYITS